ncbi:hypothetical protein [Rhodothermus profundi]|uniref:Capsule assembly protein Wzi n=1 Tax=Rhodothermus profundi TaxID=633813 RepID=A0A1M6WS44_9BACT|nr:hypothetical protein [Rhodothermus profundi]SHK96474.1 hypothetical protein SAMN04488087_2405 [Rhodothermus profundi]
MVPRRCAIVTVWLLLLRTDVTPAQTLWQPFRFGSADDPAEQVQRVWWRREHQVESWGGASLIGAHWRLGTRWIFTFVTRSLTGRLDATLRTGLYGTYRADFDSPYDALRLIDFLRYNPPRHRPVHLRVGPLTRTRLGTGHVVDFFNTTTAWDDRTIGLELGWSDSIIDLEWFVADLLSAQVAGGRIGLRPFFWARDVRTQSFTLGFSYVRDPAFRRHARLEAFNVDLSFNTLRARTFALMPFVSLAHYRHYGSGLRLGVSFQSPNFIDLMAFQLRLGLDYDGEAFLPGFVGPFYPVHNLQTRILDADAYPEATRYAGVALNEARGGNAFFTEIHLLFPRRFEFWYYFRRHYGTQRLSTFHLRLFLRTRELQFQTGISRTGLDDFFSLFQKMSDQSWLLFEVRYRLGRALWLLVHARYTFERLRPAADGTRRYLVQRRFEPMTGFRWTL